MDAVAVELDHETPAALVWHQKRYRVADTPTLLKRGEGIYEGFVTHPPLPLVRWRFLGRADDGEAFVFDVRYDLIQGAWQLLRAYD